MTKPKGKKKDSQKQTAAKVTSGENLKTLRIGSRVRCTDDGVEGRITWANGVSVKIVWDDGENVTWRRDELASKKIEIIDAETATALEPNTELPSVSATAEQTAAQEESGSQEEAPTADVPPSEPMPDAPAPEAIPEMTLPTPALAPTDVVAPEAPFPSS